VEPSSLFGGFQSMFGALDLAKREAGMGALLPEETNF